MASRYVPRAAIVAALAFFALPIGCGDDAGGAGGGAGGGVGGGAGGGVGGGAGGGVGGGAGGGGVVDVDAGDVDAGDVDAGSEPEIPSGYDFPASSLDALLDPTFGDGGHFRIPEGFRAVSMTVQPDDKIVLAGGYTPVGQDEDAALLRLSPDGALDPSFGTGGLVTLTVDPIDEESCRTVRIAPNGDIVAGGFAFHFTTITTYDVFAIRVDTNGDPVDSFGGDGIAVYDDGGTSTWGGAVAALADGTVFLAGSGFTAGAQSLVVVRLTPEGIPDDSFSGDGVHEYPLSMGVEQIAEIGLEPPGDPDAGGGVPAALYVAATAAGVTPQHCAVVKLSTTTGVPVSGFGTSGVAQIIAATETTCRDLEVRPDGSLLVSGSRVVAPSPDRQGLVARLDSSGTLDTEFDGDGLATTSLSATDDGYFLSVVPRSDGAIWATGYGAIGVSPAVRVAFRVARFTGAGALDDTFAGDGLIDDADVFSSSNIAALQDDALLVVTSLPNPPFASFLMRFE